MIDQKIQKLAKAASSSQVFTPEDALLLRPPTGTAADSSLCAVHNKQDEASGCWLQKMVFIKVCIPIPDPSYPVSALP